MQSDTNESGTVLPRGYEDYDPNWQSIYYDTKDEVSAPTPNFLSPGDSLDVADPLEALFGASPEQSIGPEVDVDLDTPLPDAPDVVSSSQVPTSQVEIPIDPALQQPVPESAGPAVNQATLKGKQKVLQPEIQQSSLIPPGPSSLEQAVQGSADPAIDQVFANEQEVPQPGSKPDNHVYPDPAIYRGAPPAYGNYQDYALHGQPYPVPMQQYPFASGQNNPGPFYGQQSHNAVAAPNGFAGRTPNQRNPGNANRDGTGRFANQFNISANNHVVGAQEFTLLDVVAEQDENIEYVSISGDVLKGADVRFNPARGFFMPLTQRRRDKSARRAGPRPGNKNGELYDMCKWHRGTKTADSECLGENVYGLSFDVPTDWELPNGLGIISYNKEGCIADGVSLSARQIRAYINHNPRNLRLMVANAPSQATHRMQSLPKTCLWDRCPNQKHNMRQGFHQIIFDEFPDQTDLGERDPFRIAARMHLWCFEQCCDIVEDFKHGRVKPEIRRLRREQKNAMALDRDCNATVVRETYEPWFRYQIMTSNGPLSQPRPFAQSLAHVLTKHHLLNQANRRQIVRDQRNQEIVDPKSMDIHQGDLFVYQQRDQSVSDNYGARDSHPDDAFQPSVGLPGYVLPDHFGRNATGIGFLLDDSLVENRVARRGRKRRRREANSNESSGGDINADEDEDERSSRPAKRPRTVASPISPRHNINTRANANSNALVFPDISN